MVEADLRGRLFGLSDYDRRTGLASCVRRVRGGASRAEGVRCRLIWVSRTRRTTIDAAGPTWSRLLELLRPPNRSVLLISSPRSGCGGRHLPREVLPCLRPERRRMPGRRAAPRE